MKGSGVGGGEEVNCLVIDDFRNKLWRWEGPLAREREIMFQVMCNPVNKTLNNFA